MRCVLCIGVRIEEDILVTETGYEVPSKRVPKIVKAIGKLMKEPNLDYRKYLIKK